ncbi:hypothetical protein D3C77_784620 [compost metagenome]
MKGAGWFWISLWMMALNSEMERMFCSFWIFVSSWLTVLSSDRGVMFFRKAL